MDEVTGDAKGRFSITSGIVWSALILGAIIGLRIPLLGSGRDINIAAFDLVAPLAFAFVVLSGRVNFAKLPWRLFAGLALAAVAVVAHAFMTYRYGAWTPIPRLAGPIEKSGLLRETVKLVTIPIELGMLMTLFSVPEFRNPPPWLLAGLGGLIAVDMIYDRIQFFNDNIPYLANIAAHSLMGVMALAIALLPGSRATRHMLALGWVAAVTVVMVIGIRKTYLMVCAVIAAVFIVTLLIDAVRDADRRMIRSLSFAIGGALVLLIGIHTVMTFEFYTGRDPLDVLVATGMYSSEVRFEIQTVAWYLAILAFPIGIGVGQFGALAPRIPEIADFNVFYMHNTPLSLVAEMGAVGMALCAGFFYLIYLACRGGDWSSILARLTFFTIPMALNDTHGLRITILVLAYFAVAEPKTQHNDAEVRSMAGAVSGV